MACRAHGNCRLRACLAPMGPAMFPPRRHHGLLSPPALTVKHKCLQQAELPVLPTFPLGIEKRRSSVSLSILLPALVCFGCGWHIPPPLFLLWLDLTTPSAFPLIPLLPYLLHILLPQASPNQSLPRSFYAGPGSTAPDTAALASSSVVPEIHPGPSPGPQVLHLSQRTSRDSGQVRPWPARPQSPAAIAAFVNITSEGDAGDCSTKHDLRSLNRRHRVDGLRRQGLTSPHSNFRE